MRTAQPGSSEGERASPAGRSGCAGNSNPAGNHIGRHTAGRISRLLSLHSGKPPDRPERQRHCAVRHRFVRRSDGDVHRAKGGPSQRQIFKKILLFSARLLCSVLRDRLFVAADFL
jgi:hypothetical protein